MKTSKCIVGAGFTWLLVSLGCTLASATDNFSIDWFSVDGAATAMTGGIFSLDGTAGQPDAAAVTLVSGTQLMKGGFWALDFSANGSLSPTLLLQRTGISELTLSWYPDPPGFRVQQSLTLMPDSWTNLLIEPANPVVLPLAGDHSFFRLIKP